MKNQKSRVFVVMLYVIYAIIMFIVIDKKASINIDEAANYTLSNSEYWFCPENGVVYEPANTPFVETMASDGHIDFKHVWDMQVLDGNHPPFYYALNHVFCAILSPGKISKWPTGILNILLQLCSLFFFRKMLDVFEVKEFGKNVISIAYMVCGGMLSLVGFYRMYVMLILLTIIFNYLLIKNISHFSWKFFVELFVVTVIGAMTQYYFIFCAFFSSLVIGIILLGEKRFKEAVLYIVVMALAGAASWMIFPQIIDQLLFNGEGVTAINNMAEANPLSQFMLFGDLLNQQLFGRMFLLVFVACIAGFIGCIIKKLYPSKENLQRYAIILVSSLGVFVFVALSAFGVFDRYISPIYGIVFVAVYVMTYKGLIGFIGEKRGNVVFAIVVAITAFASVVNANWGNVQPTNEDADYARENFSQVSAVFVWKRPTMAMTNVLEVQECKDAVYYNASDYDEFLAFDADESVFKDELVLFVAMDKKEAFFDRFLSDHPQYHAYKVFNGPYSNMYHLKTD